MTGTEKMIHIFLGLFVLSNSSKYQKQIKVFIGKKNGKAIKKTTTKQHSNASTHGLIGNEAGSQEERVPTQQMMLRQKTVSNRIMRLLQTCQLECELHVWYENEEERFSQAGCRLQGNSLEPFVRERFH